MVKVAFSFKSLGIEKRIELISQGSENCQNLRYESLIIVDHNYVEMPSFTVLNIK